MPMVPALILSSDSHVFEPPDLWKTRIDAAFRDRAPRIQRIDGADQLVVEADQVISGIGLISNAGARFEAPETISAEGRFEDVHRGGYDPDQHLADMRLDGVAGEVLYPSQGLFYFKVADTALMSAIFRAYNDWLADFCSADRSRLKGIAMINLDDIQEGVEELERTARMGFAGAMITEYPLEHRRYDHPEYEPFWAAAQGLDDAAQPAHGHPTARQDPRCRRTNAARREQPSDEGVLSRDLPVRHDLRGRLRALSRPHARHRRVRARVGSPCALHHGLHVSRAPRRGDLPVHGRYASERLLPSQCRAQLPGGRHRHSPAGCDRCGQHDVGLRLSPQRIDVPPVAADPGGDSRGSAGRANRRRSSAGTPRACTTSTWRD